MAGFPRNMPSTGSSAVRFDASIGSSASETDRQLSGGHSIRYTESIGSTVSDRSGLDSLGERTFRSTSKSGKAGQRKRFCLEDFAYGRRLGQGRFGFVHLAQENKSKKVIALKIMWKSDLEEEGLLVQVRREVEIHARIKHKNIVKMYSYFDDAERVYLVLEYASGGNLLDLMQKSPTMRLPENEAARIMRGIVEAVAFCHDQKIIHRDIKPENILLTNKKEVKVADFGWACSDDSTKAIERMKRTTFCGTLDYLPPELSRREAYDYRVDVWMTACVCYEMLVGCAPFYHEDLSETAYKIENEELELPKFVSNQARDLLSRMLVKDKEHRMSKIVLALVHPWIVQHSSKEENTEALKAISNA